METVVVTAATNREVAELIHVAGGTGTLLPGGYEVFQKRLDASLLVVAVTGIGKVNTAAAITSIVHRFEPTLLVNTGCCGAYPGSGLSVGDLAVATAEIYGDEGVETMQGWRSLETIGIPVAAHAGQSYFNRFPVCPFALEETGTLAEKMGLQVGAGPFVTVSTCSGTLARGIEVASRYGAICENMEGAAAAHVALRNGVRFLEIRGVSNLVEDRDLSRWNIDLAVRNAQRFLVTFIEEHAAHGSGDAS